MTTRETDSTRPVLVLRDEGPSKGWYVCSVCDDEIETDPASAPLEFLEHVREQHAEAAGAFITGGLKEPVIHVELPEPELTKIGSVYQDETGQYWRLGKSDAGVRWRKVRAITEEVARNRRYICLAGIAALVLFGVFWFNGGMELIPGALKFLVPLGVLCLIVFGVLRLPGDHVIVIPADEGDRDE